MIISSSFGNIIQTKLSLVMLSNLIRIIINKN